MWTATNQAAGDWLLFTDADVLFKPDSLRRALAYAEAEKADHVVLFPRMIMKRPGEYMMIAFFQTMFMFGHRPWKVADPKARDHMGVGAFNLVRRSVYEAVGTYERLRMEVVDDMKLGKVIKNAGFAQRNVFGADLISIRWAHGAMGVVDNLTKNFFAVLSFQWWRTLLSAFGLAFINLGPFLGVWLAHGWARVPYALALGSMFLIYVGMSWRSGVPPYYFLLHPVSTVLFIYTLLRSTALTLWNGGIMWRGTKYPAGGVAEGDGVRGTLVVRCGGLETKALHRKDRKGSRTRTQRLACASGRAAPGFARAWTAEAAVATWAVALIGWVVAFGVWVFAEGCGVGGGGFFFSWFL